MTSSGPRIGGLVRRVGRTGVTNGLAKGVLLLGVLGTAPLIESHLGAERLGVWLTLVTFTSLLSFADLGLGNGVMTRVARSSGADDGTQARTAVANGLALLISAATVMTLFVILASTTVDIPSIFGVTDAAISGDVSKAVTVFALLLAAGLPLTTIEKVQWGLRRGYLASTFLLASAVTTIVAVVVIVGNDGTLVHLAAAFAGIPALFAAANSLWSFLGPIKHLRPRPGDISLRGSLQLLKIGSMFLALQLAASLAFSTDNVIVARFLGAETVSSLAIPARLFGLVSFGSGLFLMPLWPEYANAIAGNNSAWATRTFLHVLRVAGGVSAVAAVVVAGTSFLLLPLLGEPGTPTISLLFGLALWTILLVIGSATSVFFNAVGAMRVQMLASIVMVAVVLTLKAVLVTRIGIEGVVWGGVIGYAAVMGPTFAWYTTGVLRRLRE